MAWDTELTRRRLKQAATDEFAEHGYEGGRISRIAERAGVNKERLYSYFGDKRTLWELVLTDELDALAAAIQVAGVGLEEIGEFAGQTFAYHAAHPRLARLLQWEGLQGGPPAAVERRSLQYRAKVERVRRAQAAGTITSDLDAAHLVFALIALAAWWQTVPQLAALITGVDASAAQEQQRRHDFVVAAARRLAAP